MPSLNTHKVFIQDHFYHIYNRGWNYGEIFLEEADCRYFEEVLQRHISIEPVADARGRLYAHMRPDIDLNAYCLMPNHFHMLVYIRDEAAATKFISSVMTAYTMYFNKKYKRRGPLCESRFKAVVILQNDQLMHITRYIHLNNSSYKTWPWSSYHDYAREHPRNWINSAPILELFTGKEAYLEFVDGYAELQRERDSIKKELAAG